MNKSEQYRIQACRICRQNNLVEFLSLGSMPIPNGFLTKAEVNGPEPKYPLSVSFCSTCSLVQLTHVIPAEIMFKNYLYIPSTSQTMLQHFEALAEEAVEKFEIRPGDLVIDIGSNDGTLLKFFKAFEAQTLGIDPASNLAVVARLQGIDTIDDFFTKQLAGKVVKEKGQAKTITATNVIAHIDDLHDTFEGISLLLRKDGVFIGEFPYLSDLLARNEFDSIYHEHLSYFSLHALMKLFEQHSLDLIDIKKMPVHGGSIRIYAVPKDSSLNPSPNIQRFLDNEKALNLLDQKPYHGFAKRVSDIKEELLGLLKKLRQEGKRIVGYGASAKGNVLFNYCGIGPDLIEYIVDSIPYKQGRFTPGTHIPIYPEKKLELDMPDYALILAWNFADEIMRKQAKYREKGGQFIITIPTLRIE